MKETVTIDFEHYTAQLKKLNELEKIVKEIMDKSLDDDRIVLIDAREVGCRVPVLITSNKDVALNVLKTIFDDLHSQMKKTENNNRVMNAEWYERTYKKEEGYDKRKWLKKIFEALNL